MRFLEGVYKRLNVVVCNFSGADSYTISYIRCYRTKSEISFERADADDREWLLKYPSVVLISGYGVVIKPVKEGDETIAKVTGETENFVWNYSADGTNLCFARRSQMEKLTDTLTEDGIKVFKTECCVAEQGSDDAFLIQTMQAIYADTIKYKCLLKPTEQNSVLALYLYKRLRMPILVILFVLLLANMFVERSIGDKYAATNAELKSLRSNDTERQQSDNASRAIVSEFNNSVLDVRYAIICDCIGSVVPANITLTALLVQPKLKAIEQGKRPVLSDKAIVIQGTARSAEDISSFVVALGKLGFMYNVELASLGTGRSSTSPQFQINARL